MLNPRLAHRYAKSLLDLAVEKNCLDAVLADMQLINNICTKSPDFTSMLRSPVISGDKKLSIINQILKAHINNFTSLFLDLIVSKGRELNLPEIAVAFTEQYNELKNIRLVKITTAAAISPAIAGSIQAKVATYLPEGTIELTTAVNEDLIGGFVLEFQDKQYDASIRKHLSDVRARVTDNSYVNKL